MIVSGGIDLSQGSAIALATVLGAKFATNVTDNPLLVILVVIAVGAGVGLANGIIVEYVRIGSPFVVTLATLSMCSSLAYVISGGATIVGMPQFIDVLGASYVAKVPISAFVVVGFAVLIYGLARRVRWGRWLFATGGNRPGATRLGISTRQVVVSAFVVSGIAVGVASVLIMGYTNSGYPTAGTLAELDAISAVALGERVPVLAVRSAFKRYGAVTALVDVSLDLYAGEVLALLGDNGAGKSTLIKCLTGAQSFDQGEVFIDGHPAGIRSPEDGRRHGIEVVYQDLALFDNLTLTENFFVGREDAVPDRLGALALLRRSKMRTAVRDALTSLEVRIKDPTAVVGVMSGGQRQAIAVARAVAFASRIVILDEPTAALGIRETSNVLRLVRTLATNGISVILISHNLEQVSAVADRTVVLRQGRKIGECRPTPDNHDRIVSMIVGASS